MASTRLRKAFKYPEDEGEDEGRQEGLDEQEQDKIVEDIQEWDRRSTQFWKELITGTILIIACFYFALLVYSKEGSKSVLSALHLLTGVFAAVASAALVYRLPQPLQDRAPVLGEPLTAVPVPAILQSYDLKNIDSIACALQLPFFILTALNGDKRQAAPGLVALGIALLGRHTLRPIGTAELERLKYNYKGA